MKEVQVLLSDAEAQWLETVAATEGVTLEHWCRECLLELAQQHAGYAARTEPPAKERDPWPPRPVAAVVPKRTETDRNFPAYEDQDDIPTKPDHKRPDPV